MAKAIEAVQTHFANGLQVTGRLVERVEHLKKEAGHVFEGCCDPLKRRRRKRVWLSHSLQLLSVVVQDEEAALEVHFLTCFYQTKKSLDMKNKAFEKLVVKSLAKVKYRFPEVCKRDVLAVLAGYRGLAPQHDTFVFDNGEEMPLLNVNGTIPIVYKGNTYNIPICFWLLVDYPAVAPMAYVKPTNDMQIKVNESFIAPKTCSNLFVSGVPKRGPGGTYISALLVRVEPDRVQLGRPDRDLRLDLWPISASLFQGQDLTQAHGLAILASPNLVRRIP